MLAESSVKIDRFDYQLNYGDRSHWFRVTGYFEGEHCANGYGTDPMEAFTKMILDVVQ